MFVILDVKDLFILLIEYCDDTLYDKQKHGSDQIGYVVPNTPSNPVPMTTIP